MELRALRFAKSAAHRKAVSQNCPSSWSNYRRIRNHCSLRFRKFKAQYLSELANHPTKSKSFWNELSYLKSSSKVSTTFIHMASEFDEYFSSIPYDTIKDISGNGICPTQYLSLSDIPSF